MIASTCVPPLLSIQNWTLRSWFRMAMDCHLIVKQMSLMFRSLVGDIVVHSASPTNDEQLVFAHNHCVNRSTTVSCCPQTRESSRPMGVTVARRAGVRGLLGGRLTGRVASFTMGDSSEASWHAFVLRSQPNKKRRPAWRCAA